MEHQIQEMIMKSGHLNPTAKKSRAEFLRNIDFESQNKFFLANMISSEDFGKTLEAEAHYLFVDRASYINNYSLRDAKELENEFKKIDGIC